MRIEEAKYIRKLLKKHTNDSKITLLNLGSSTKHFRKIEQPHIDSEIFYPLKELNYKIVHFDLKDADGVDISGNIFDLKIQKKLQTIRPNLLLVCNLLEHLEQTMRKNLPLIIDDIIADNGMLIITVPYSYPLHLDPIDTYYRPSPKQISQLFPNYEMIDGSVITSRTFFSEYVKYDLSLKIKLAIRVFIPFYKFKSWLCLAHRMLWLFRPYKISCVILRKK